MLPLPVPAMPPELDPSLPVPPDGMLLVLPLPMLPLPMLPLVPLLPVPLPVEPPPMSLPPLMELHPASASTSRLARTTLCCFRFMINSLCLNALQWVSA
jgi:hypothetical protein